MHWITTATPGRDRTIHLVYDDGATYHVDLAPVVDAGGVFAPLRDIAFFRSLAVGHRGRSIEWTGDLALDADALRMGPDAFEGSPPHRILASIPPRAIPNAVSAEITRALREAGLTQAQVAARMGTSQPAVARLASPTYHGHSVSSLSQLAEALGMKLEVRFTPRQANGRNSHNEAA